MVARLLRWNLGLPPFHFPGFTFPRIVDVDLALRNFKAYSSRRHSTNSDCRPTSVPKEERRGEDINNALG
jgi:hypothetical protein